MLRKKEITALTINAVLVKMLFEFPRTVILNSGNSAWMQIIYNLIIVLLIFFVTAKFYEKKKNIIEVADELGGKGLRIAVGIVMFVILSVNFLSVIRLFPETVKIVLLKDTPVNMIVFLFAAAAAFGAYMGINSIARIHCIFLPIANIILVLFIILLAPYYKVENIMPFFGEGAKKLFVNGFETVSLFADIILLNILLPYAQTLNDVKKSGYKSILISGGLSVIIMLAYCMLYPYPVSENFIFPVYQMTRMVHLSSFFSRFEAIFQFVWSLLLLLYASVYVYILSYIFQITFSLKYIKPVIVPVVIICYSLSLIPSSLAQTVGIEELISKIVFPLVFIIPFIAGIMGRYKKNKEN